MSDSIRNLLYELKRVLFDIILWVVLLFLFISSSRIEWLSQPVQLLFFKALTVSMGFLHAHILRKLAFSKIGWDTNEEDVYKKILVISLYVIVIFAYARGG